MSMLLCAFLARVNERLAARFGRARRSAITGKTMSEPPDPTRLQRLAAEIISEAAGLTDDLTDAEARPLIAWAQSQAEVAAQQVTWSQARPGLPAEELHAILADRLGPVRKVIKMLSRLAVERHSLAVEEITKELESIRDLAGRLPNPATPATISFAPADLAARQAGMDHTAFVSAVLALLGRGEPPAPAEMPGVTPDTGGDNDDQKGP